MKLEVIYEDKDVLVCFKMAGIATQTAKLSSQDIVSMLKNYLARETKDKNPYIGVIHRLDQPVSGLLVFAKNKSAAAALSKQIQDGNANKDYIARCSGKLEDGSGKLLHYIGKDSTTRLAVAISEAEYSRLQNEEKASYKEAILTYEVVEEREDSSIIKVHLQTGRFHQIRAQFSAIGHPLLGDVKYGTDESKSISNKLRIRNVALCANRLTFYHPVSKKEMEFVLPKQHLPKEMRTKENEA